MDRSGLLRKRKKMTGKYKLKQADVRMVLKESEGVYSAKPITNAEAAVEVLKELFSGMDREMMVVINLDTKLRPISYHIVAIGTTNTALFDIKNCFKTAILQNSTSIMLAHNHPSGDPSPSGEDIAITRKVAEAGKVIDIELVDHIVVGASKHISIRETNRGIFS